MEKALKFLPIAVLFLLACNPEKVDTSAVKEEMENYKIRRISQGEIMEQSKKTGNDLFDFFQKKTVNVRLDSLLKNGRFEDALSFCSYYNYPEKVSLEKKYGAAISRIGLPGKLRNEKSVPDSLQKLILEAYLYNRDKGLGYFDDVQILEKEIVYSRPILLDQESCLRCHGDIEKEIGQENYSKISSRYPRDQSVNFKKGALIGVFSVKLNKEELIRSIK